MQPRQNWHDAVDTKLALHHWYQSATGREWALYTAREFIVNERIPENSAALHRGLWAAEIGTRIPGATPFFVSREMCELVDYASDSFEPEPILPTDLLNLQGFLLYEKPFVIPDRYDRPVSISGISWQPLMGSDDVEPHRPLTREDEMMEWLEERHQQGKVDGLGLTIYQPSEGREKIPGAPPIVPLHLTPWFWGMTFDGNEVDIHGKPTGAAWWWRIIQTTFRLMQQHIAVRHKERPSRPQRREAKRYGLPVDDVVVVRLRREKSDPHPDQEPGSANYSHRFLRQGHWRNQFYPSARTHRQIYIATTVVGDESLPLVIKPRAYNWSR